MINFYQFRQVKSSLGLGQDKIKELYINECLKQLTERQDNEENYIQDSVQALLLALFLQKRICENN